MSATRRRFGDRFLDALSRLFGFCLCTLAFQFEGRRLPLALIQKIPIRVYYLWRVKESTYTHPRLFARFRFLIRSRLQTDSAHP